VHIIETEPDQDCKPAPQQKSMSRQFANICAKLADNEMKVLMTEEQFLVDKRVQYACPVGHVSSLAKQAFINKTAPSKLRRVAEGEEAPPLSLCAVCNSLAHTHARALEATKQLGFELLGVDRSENGQHHRITFRCHCGSTSSTTWNNLHREVIEMNKDKKRPSCRHCQNDDRRKEFAAIQRSFQDRGCLLLLENPADYRNNRQPLPFRCACGNEEALITFHDLCRGRLCGSCKTQRAKDTCLAKYGVDNPSKSDEVKQKIVKTNLERHGVSYPQQSAVIRAKVTKTSMTRYGVPRAFCLPEVFEKIRATHRSKYGVDFPLQSRLIQDKIDITFKQSLGATRPFLSDAFLRSMEEKYGAKWFVQTEQFKKKMLERYGVEHATQNAELFRRAQASSYHRKKRYVNWDGQVFMLLGYEDKALDDLIAQEGAKIICAGEDPAIPVFDYVGEDNRMHKYYPDFFIPSENRVIEVKSVYTYNMNPPSVRNKALAVSETCLFELRLYDERRMLVEVLECRHGLFYSHTQAALVLGEKFEPKKV